MAQSFNISLNYPEVVSATKRIEKTKSNILLRIAQEVTVKGKLLAINNQSNYTSIWNQINAIQDNKSAKNCALNFRGLVSYGAAKILNISFDNTNNQDVKAKDFSITFEVYERVSTSILTNYGIQLDDLKEISDIKISQVREEDLDGVTLTNSVGITFAENATNYNLSRAQNIARAILVALNVLSISTPSRTTASNIYDEKTGTYNFIEVKNKFRGSTGGFTILRSNNFNIQENGAIIASENSQIKIEKNNDFTISELSGKAKSEADQAQGRCQSFVSSYYNLGYGILSPSYRGTFKETTRQITVDEASGTAQYNVSLTNESEYLDNVRVEIIETIEDLKKEKAKRKIVRGTIIGMKNPPDKEISPTSNKKLSFAKAYFDANYKSEFTSGNSMNSPSSSIGNNKTYITNGDVTYNISEGSINFSLTYEDRPEYVVTNSDLIYGFAEITNQSAVHLANQFLVVGGNSPGEEVIQESAQSRPVEINLRVEGLFKTPDKVKNYVKSFQDLVKNNYKDGIITALNISMNLIARTFQGTATWLKFGEYRERTDTATKVSAPGGIDV